MIVVSLINMKGGVAKTTLSINIADCLVRRHGFKVLLIDVDPQFNATQCLMKPQAYMDHLDNNRDTIVSVFDRTHRPLASTVKTPSTAVPKDLKDIQVIRTDHKFDVLPGNLELYRLEMAPGSGSEYRLKNF